MEKIQAWRDTISWLVAAVTVALSYEIRSEGYITVPEIGFKFIDGILPAFLATILLLSSLYIARKSSKLLISKEWVRSRILKENFVEGYWYLKTDPLDKNGENDKSPLSPDGVLWMRYEPELGDFAVLTTRLDSNGIAYQVTSKLIQMREEQQHLLYVNFFIVDHEGEHPTEGVSKGRFIKQGDFSRRKDRFDAYIFTEGEKTRHQYAEMIAEHDISKFKKLAEKNGTNNWMKEFLKNTNSCKP